MEHPTQPGNGHDPQRPAGDAARATNELAEQASTVAADASAALRDTSHQLSEAYQRFAESGRACVRSSPGASVLLALLAGWGLSRLFFTRR